MIWLTNFHCRTKLQPLFSYKCGINNSDIQINATIQYLNNTQDIKLPSKIFLTLSLAKQKIFLQFFWSILQKVPLVCQEHSFVINVLANTQALLGVRCQHIFRHRDDILISYRHMAGRRMLQVPVLAMQSFNWVLCWLNFSCFHSFPDYQKSPADRTKLGGK